ncbi:hypothetical protein N7510_004312 [Penicillium lagena]|uniref:uncharacterized protein n=1 Tax=Penicillium lagena TaxID=94218 RepID=UPI0025415113|nr:uncharacterized protein N7510_004312 [Penicillium lagena]KAJ5620328.1 hypothetical protein N7510_004312 [Penicillium lagena]
MSANLDRSLDDLVGNRRKSGRRGARRASASKASTVGGVKKSTKSNKGTAKAVHPTPAATPSSKIIVSGLPADVTEANIKEYFTKSAGPVKRVMLTYNQNGTSRGIASIIFGKADTAAKAAKELNGLLVDGRPIKIEVVFDASHAPQVPAPKPLGERIAQKAQKAQPKPATAGKAANARGRRATRGRGRGGRNPGRPQKTVEDLDADMADYFNENGPADASAPVNGAAAAPAANAGEDLGMGEIS